MPEPVRDPSLKSKWIAGLLSFFIPGAGQFYLGLMQRGLFIMLLIVTDICVIVFLANSAGYVNIPLITLFSLLIPVIYVYNIFDAMQAAEAVNARKWAIHEGRVDAVGEPSGDPLTKLMGGANAGVLLLLAGFIVYFASHEPRWLEDSLSRFGSSAGALLLIVAGVVLFLINAGNKRNK